MLFNSDRLSPRRCSPRSPGPDWMLWGDCSKCSIRIILDILLLKKFLLWWRRLIKISILTTMSLPKMSKVIWDSLILTATERWPSTSFKLLFYPHLRKQELRFMNDLQQILCPEFLFIYSKWRTETQTKNISWISSVRSRSKGCSTSWTRSTIGQLEAVRPLRGTSPRTKSASSTGVPVRMALGSWKYADRTSASSRSSPIPRSLWPRMLLSDPWKEAMPTC